MFYLRSETIQGYLAHKKQRPPRTLQQGYAWGPMAVLRGGAVSYERGRLCTPRPLKTTTLVFGLKSVTFYNLLLQLRARPPTFGSPSCSLLLSSLELSDTKVYEPYMRAQTASVGPGSGLVHARAHVSLQRPPFRNNSEAGRVQRERESECEGYFFRRCDLLKAFKLIISRSIAGSQRGRARRDRFPKPVTSFPRFLE